MESWAGPGNEAMLFHASILVQVYQLHTAHRQDPPPSRWHCRSARLLCAPQHFWLPGAEAYYWHCSEVSWGHWVPVWGGVLPPALLHPCQALDWVNTSNLRVYNFLKLDLNIGMMYLFKYKPHHTHAWVCCSAVMFWMWETSVLLPSSTSSLWMNT